MDQDILARITALEIAVKVLYAHGSESAKDELVSLCQDVVGNTMALPVSDDYLKLLDQSIRALAGSR